VEGSPHSRGRPGGLRSLVLKSLLVEDNAEFRAFVKGLLVERFPGLVVEEADDAAEALLLVAAGGHDLFVIDIALAGRINGLALIAEIRSRGRRSPILVMSSHSIPEYQLEAARLGADWFLSKVTCTRQQIIAAVERLALLGGRIAES
jgi:two-component system, OmpR family, response regulator